MGRPCANPYCSNSLANDARRGAVYCDDTCGRRARRLKADPEFAALRAADVFWGSLKSIRRLAPGQVVKGGTSRRENAQPHREATA